MKKLVGKIAEVVESAARAVKGAGRTTGTTDKLSLIMKPVDDSTWDKMPGGPDFEPTDDELYGLDGHE